ncbi:MAG: PfkB family carbohydrate kinase [Candidatus Parcubacteria bacterium]|nr:PfkB family carbohydrate kinase [Candidatus Parcubacteria bacterium]
MNVLVVGDPVIDKYTWGNINRMSPEDDSVPVFDVHSEEVRLGGALNVACNLKSLHRENDIFIAAPMSIWTVDELQFKSISTVVSAVFSDCWTPSERELVKERLTALSTNKQIVRIDNRIKFDSDVISIFEKEFDKTVIDYFDCIVISDYNKGIVTQHVVDRLKKFKGPIFVDTKKKDLSIWKSFSDIFLKINWNEFTVSEHTNQIKNLIVTHGDKPVQLRKFGKQSQQFMVHSVKKGDPVGCGDVFLAALVVNFMETNDIQGAIEFAIKAAGKSMLTYGTCEVRRDDV